MADFDAPSGFAFTWDADLAQRIYYDLRDKMGPSFQQPDQDAETYADAMCFAVAKLQIDEASNQTDPSKTSFLIEDLERDYLICPEVNATLSERRAALSAAMAGASGSTEASINSALITLLGTDLIGWRTMRVRVPPDVSGGPWETITIPGGDVVRSVAYSPDLDRWVAVAQNFVATSDDNGETWISRTPASSSSFAAVAWGNGAFVAVASSSTTSKVQRSTDGITWTLQTVSSSSALRSVIYAGGQFVAVGSGGLCATSPTGETWTVQTTPITQSFWCIAYGLGKYVILSVVSGSTAYSVTSSDGVSWNSTLLPEANSWRGIAFNGSMFVGVSSDGTHTVCTSINGSDFTVVDESRATNSVVFDGSLFVKIGDGEAQYSRDGISWAAGSSSLPTASLTNISAATGNGYVFAVWASATTAVRRLRPDFDGDAQVFPGASPGVITPVETAIKIARIGGVSITGESRAVDQTSINNTGILKVGDVATVGAGTANEEVVTVESATFRIASPPALVYQLIATFTKPHEDGELITTQHLPRWGSSARHYMIFVESSVMQNRTKLAQVHNMMHKIVSVGSTWTVVDTVTRDGAMYGKVMRVDSGRVGVDPIGSVMVESEA